MPIKQLIFIIHLIYLRHSILLMPKYNLFTEFGGFYDKKLFILDSPSYNSGKSCCNGGKSFCNDI